MSLRISWKLLCKNPYSRIGQFPEELVRFCLRYFLQVKKSFPCCQNISCDPPICTRYLLIQRQCTLSLYQKNYGPWLLVLILIQFLLNSNTNTAKTYNSNTCLTGWRQRTLEWPFGHAVRDGNPYTTCKDFNFFSNHCKNIKRWQLVFIQYEEKHPHTSSYMGMAKIWSHW